MRRHFTAMLAIAGVAALLLFAQSAMNAQAASSAERALKAAMDKEIIDGDLKGAIKQYDKLVKGRDRSIAARALVRMAECYEKLGDAQARTSYERAIRDFGDQKEAVATARTRLAALDARKPGTGVVERTIAQRLGGRIYGSAVSRDGRYVAFRGNVGAGLHDLASGEVRVLMQQPTIANYPPLISPDGKLVAVAVTGPGLASRIHLLSTDQTNDRILATQKSAVPLNWSADGRSLVAYELANDGNTADARIVIVSVADGTSKVIGPATAFQVGGGVGFQPRISPDGRYIAFGKFGGRAAPDTNIYIRPVDGGAESVLAEGASSGLSNGVWTPDRSRLLFTSDRGSGNELWSLRVQDGKALGRPVLVKPGVGSLLGLTQDGEFFYQLKFNTEDVYVAGVDGETGKLAGAPKVDTAVTGNLYPSPDGQFDIYLPNGRTVAIRSTKTGEERRFPIGLVVSMRWFPDSKSLLWHGANGTLFQLDPRTGESRALFNSEGIEIYFAGNAQPTVSLAPDGKKIYYLVRNPNGPQTSIFSRDLAGGAKQELMRLSADIVGGLSISPDGGRFAFLTPGPEAASGQSRVWSLMTMPVSGGEPKLVVSQAGMSPAPAGVQGTGAVWSGDGRRLLFIKHGQPDDVFVVSADGGDPQPLGISLHGLSSLRMHPNGRQISFVDTQADNQLLAVKNLMRGPNAAP